MNARNRLNFIAAFFLLFLIKCNFVVLEENKQETNISLLETAVEELLQAEDDMWTVLRNTQKVPDSIDEKTKFEKRKNETRKKLEDARNDPYKHQVLLEHVQRRNEDLRQQGQQLLKELEESPNAANYKTEINKLKSTQKNLQDSNTKNAEIQKKVQEEDKMRRQRAPMNWFAQLLDFIITIFRLKYEFLKRALSVWGIILP